MGRFSRLRYILWFVFAIEFVTSVAMGVYMFSTDNNALSLLLFAKLFLVFFPLGYVILYWHIAVGQMTNTMTKISEGIKNMDIEKCNEVGNIIGIKEIRESIGILKNKTEEENKIHQILNKILISTVTNLELESFFDSVMNDIMRVVDSNWAVFYSVNKITNRLEIKSSIGFGKGLYSQFDISIGEGFVGQAVLKNEVEIINDLPEDSIYVSKTFLGKMNPKNIMVVPIDDEEGEVIGVIAVASVHKYTKTHIGIMNDIRRYIAYAINNGDYYNKNVRLTNELKFQNQLIQNLNDDLENRIKERTLLLNNIIDSIENTAIISIDQGKRINIINKDANKIFNIEEAVGKPIRYICAGNDNFERVLMRNIEMVNEEKKVKDQCEYISRNGKSFKFEIELFLLENETDEEKNMITIVIKF